MAGLFDLNITRTEQDSPASFASYDPWQMARYGAAQTGQALGKNINRELRGMLGTPNDEDRLRAAKAEIESRLRGMDMKDPLTAYPVIIEVLQKYGFIEQAMAYAKEYENLTRNRNEQTRKENRDAAQDELARLRLERHDPRSALNQALDRLSAEYQKLAGLEEGTPEYERTQKLIGILESNLVKSRKEAIKFTDAGDRVVVLDSDGNIVREIQKGIRPADPKDPKKGKQTKAEETDEKNKQNAQKALNLLRGIEALIDAATGSLIGAGRDAVMGAFGKATSASEAAAQLEAIGGQLIMLSPRMEGPQSDKDVALYRQMAGNISDRTKPADDKKAAVRKIRELNRRTLGVPENGGLDEDAPSTPRETAPVRNAPLSGRKPATPRTKAEYEALPSGSLYVHPNDGNTYRKP